MIVVYIVVGCYLVVMSVWDIWKRKIPVLPGIVMLPVVAAVHLVQQHGWVSWLPGLLIGGVMWGLSRVSRGGIGEGDALIYLVVGIAFGLARTFEVLLISLTISSAVGIILLVFFRVGRRYAIPFVPMTAAAYGLMMLLEKGVV